MVLNPVLNDVMQSILKDADNSGSFTWLTDQHGIYITDQYGEKIEVPD